MESFSQRFIMLKCIKRINHDVSLRKILTQYLQGWSWVSLPHHLPSGCESLRNPRRELDCHLAVWSSENTLRRDKTFLMLESTLEEVPLNLCGPNANLGFVIFQKQACTLSNDT